jgi:AcrR family transcriptional regulator
VPATSEADRVSAGSGARTRLPRDERRAQLLGAARDVFVAQGYHAAAMDDIAERAGVSKPVLYQHFPGKLDLYLALLDQAADDLIVAVQAALSSTDENRERAAATTEAYFRFVHDEGGTFRLVFESDLTNEPAVRERVDRVTHRCAEAISELIAEDAGLSRAESMLLAVSLVGLQQQAARYWLDQEGPVELDDAVRLVSTLAWRGIRGFPRAGEGPQPS